MTSEETRNHSVVTKHRLDLNHDFFDWEGTEIVDHERFLYKWRIGNAIHSVAKKQS